MGLWIVNKVVLCKTLENPWKDNHRNVSCIPEGTYVLTRTESQRFGRTFEISGVPGRTRILVHWGNRVRDTEGCVLLGTKFGQLQGEPAVLASRAGFKKFDTYMNLIDVQRCVLIVEGLGI